jgi:hypothetical protein
MELPTDIWYEIVKYSKRNNEEIINDMDLKELEKFEALIAMKKKWLFNQLVKNLTLELSGNSLNIQHSTAYEENNSESDDDD